jgi:rhodanese-related sulfurtransferase
MLFCKRDSYAQLVGQLGNVTIAALAVFGVNFTMHHASGIEDLTATEAWEFIKNAPNAALVDVRSIPEWSFVGVPSLDELPNPTLMLSWRIYPSMEVNTRFVEKLQEEIPDTNTPLVFLCKSGGRSHDAAEAMIQAGYSRCINIVDGFEGRPNDQARRGTVDGWKAANLPWHQS